jgi:hypothetical protein
MQLGTTEGSTINVTSGILTPNELIPDLSISIPDEEFVDQLTQGILGELPPQINECSQDAECLGLLYIECLQAILILSQDFFERKDRCLKLIGVPRSYFFFTYTCYHERDTYMLTTTEYTILVIMRIHKLHYIKGNRIFLKKYVHLQVIRYSKFQDAVLCRSLAL